MHWEGLLSISSLAGRRLLLVAEYGAIGGTRTYFMQLVDFYANQGVELTVVRPDLPDDIEMAKYLLPRCRRVLAYSDVVRPRPTSGIPLTHAGQITSLLSLRRERATIGRLVAQERCEAVVVSAGRPGALIGAVRAGPPSLYVMHTYPHGWRSRLLGRLVYGRLLSRRIWVLTVSQAARKEIVRAWLLQGSDSRVTVIYSSVGPPLLLAPEREGPITVLTIGAVEDYKGIEVFMRLAAQASSVWPSDEVKFVWAGGGTQLASCRERALREGLSNIVFLGAVEDTQALYSGSHIYLQPSHVESLGLALLDACRHGLPSLVSGAGGLPEVVEDGLTGFVVELGAHHAWFVALRSLVEDPSLRNRMGKEACESYRNRFGPQRWESKMMALHQRLLASK